jgi:hypothetical protein
MAFWRHLFRKPRAQARAVSSSVPAETTAAAAAPAALFDTLAASDAPRSTQQRLSLEDVPSLLPKDPPCPFPCRSLYSK